MQLEFTANPVTGEMMTKLALGAKAGEEVMSVIRQAISQTEGDPLGAIRRALLGTDRAKKLVHKKVVKTGKEVNWLRHVVVWAQADPETRGSPPKPPSYIEDPLKWLGAVRTAYGSEYESTLFSSDRYVLQIASSAEMTFRRAKAKC